MYLLCIYITDGNIALHTIANLSVAQSMGTFTVMKHTGEMVKLLEISASITPIKKTNPINHQLALEIENNMQYIKLAYEVLEYTYKLCNKSSKRIASILDFQTSGNIFSDNTE